MAIAAGRHLAPGAVFLLALCLARVEAFLQPPATPVIPHALTDAQGLKQCTNFRAVATLPGSRTSFLSRMYMLSLRDNFFAAVDEELKTQFPPGQGDISRVRAFVESCKAGTVPPSAPTDLPYFQPSEEYVPGLTAKPWHDPYSFE